MGTAALRRPRSLVATSTDCFLLPLRCELGEELVPRPRLGAAWQRDSTVSCLALSAVLRHSYTWLQAAVDWHVRGAAGAQRGVVSQEGPRSCCRVTAAAVAHKPNQAMLSNSAT